MIGISAVTLTFAIVSVPELLIVLAILILIFGAKKLPALGDAFGKGIRNFKKGIEKGAEEEEEIDITPAKKALDSESTSSVKDVKVEDSVTL